MLQTFFIVFWLVLPLVVWIALLCARVRMHPAILAGICVFAMLVGYASMLTAVWIVDTRLEAEMNSYDLDGDGGIGGEELTPAAERAIDEWASDTGRTFAPIVGVPLTAIWYTILFVMMFGGQWMFRKALSSRAANRSQTTDARMMNYQPEDGNPFRPPSDG